MRHKQMIAVLLVIILGTGAAIHSNVFQRPQDAFVQGFDCGGETERLLLLHCIDKGVQGHALEDCIEALYGGEEEEKILGETYGCYERYNR